MRILAIVCLVLFAITFPLGLALFSLESHLFDQQIYKAALERMQPETALPDFVAQTIVEQVNAPANTSPSFKGVEKESLKTFILGMVPAGAFQATAEDVLAQSLDYAQLKRQDVSISLEPFIAKLDTPEGMAQFKTFLSAYPKCTGAQLEAMLKESQQEKVKGEMVLCRPPGEFHTAHGDLLLSEYLPRKIEAMAGTIPSETVLIRVPAQGQDFRLALASARPWMRYSFVIPVLLLLAATALVVRSLRSWLRWWGFAFLAAGVLGVLMASGLTPWIAAQTSNYLVAALDSVPALFVDFAVDVLGALLGQAFQFILRGSTPAAILGAILLVVELVLNKRSPAVQMPVAPQT